MVSLFFTGDPLWEASEFVFIHSTHWCQIFKGPERNICSGFLRAFFFLRLGNWFRRLVWHGVYWSLETIPPRHCVSGAAESISVTLWCCGCPQGQQILSSGNTPGQQRNVALRVISRLPKRIPLKWEWILYPTGMPQGVYCQEWYKG